MQALSPESTNTYKSCKRPMLCSRSTASVCFISKHFLILGRLEIVLSRQYSETNLSRPNRPQPAKEGSSKTCQERIPSLPWSVSLLAAWAGCHCLGCWCWQTLVSSFSLLVSVQMNLKWYQIYPQESVKTKASNQICYTWTRPDCTALRRTRPTGRSSPADSWRGSGRACHRSCR